MMALRLRVLGTKAERLGDRWSRVFGVHGGHLGRAADCDWVLPDPERYLSGHHAAIEYRGGHWYVVDTSMNGTFVNGSTHALGRDRAYALQDGDRIRMGEYDFLVSITPDNDFVPDIEALNQSLDGIPHDLDLEPVAPDLFLATHGDIGAELDLKSLLASPIPPPDTPEWPRLIDLHSPAPTPAGHAPTAAVSPAPADSGSLRIVDAFGQEVDTPFARQARASRAAAAAAAPPSPAPPVLTPPPTPSPVAEPVRDASATSDMLPSLDVGMRVAPKAAAPDGGTAFSGSSPLAAFCRGAGIDAAKLPEQDAALVLALAGQLLREFALGLMLGLQHRAEQKHAIRASHTAITALANNPFKVARSVEEALQRVLGARSQRFLPPVEAVRAGFADLQRHEQATLAGLQDALGDYLVRFAPEQLEEQFERSLSRVPGANAEGVTANKARYWEMYAEMFRVLAYAGPDGLPHAFAESFAEAYARQDEEVRKGKEDGSAPRLEGAKK